METKVLIKKNSYKDSVTLMALSRRMKAMPGVSEAVVSMATAMNKELLEHVGMTSPEVTEAGANDLMIAVQADGSEACTAAIQFAEDMLSHDNKAAGHNRSTVGPKSLSAAMARASDANIAVISVPGVYAAREARAALKGGLNVLMFSDNVSLQDELNLKELAHQSKLFMMGPDCGTAIINNVGLCFANSVRQGNIGVIGASGTGIQEVTVLIDRFGGGISQAIGTGGRDLSETIGGITMFDALDALNEDESTEVIVLVSKPPARSVVDKIIHFVCEMSKPVVVSFVGSRPSEMAVPGLHVAETLEDAARKAVQLTGKAVASVQRDDAQLAEVVNSVRNKLSPKQRYVRGLYCGGTLCHESINIVQAHLGAVYSNISKQPEYRLANPQLSKEHTFIDLGDDAFTVGHPHPMIEPSLRIPRLLQEAADPEVAVILLDVVLGYGANDNPAGILAPAVAEAKRLAASGGRYLHVIGYVCGTDKDKQNKAEQMKKLADVGVWLANSNAEAAMFAAATLAQKENLYEIGQSSL